MKKTAKRKSATSKQIIQVEGDAVTDIFTHPRTADSGEGHPAWKRLPGFCETRHRGGSLLLTALIDAAFPSATVFSSDEDNVPLTSRARLANYNGIWRGETLDGFEANTATPGRAPKPHCLDKATILSHR